MSGTKSKSKQQEALQILDDLDSLSPNPRAPAVDSAGPATAAIAANPGEAAEVLAFLDEITQKSSEPTRPAASLLDRPLSRSGTPTLRKSTERVKLGGSSLTNPASSPVRGVSPSSSPSNPGPGEKQAATPDHERKPSGGGWGWGSVWSSASSAIQQARTVVDEQVKSLPTQDPKKWREGVLGYARNAQERAQEYAKSAQLDKLGLSFDGVPELASSTFNEILNAVAPPISEHEVIQVWLSHDMQGLEGVEPLVYSALTREGGDLVVNKGNESKPKETSKGRDFNAVEGLEQALKLALANVEEVIKTNAPPDPQIPSSVQNPTMTSFVYLRIEPFTSTIAISEPNPVELRQLQFILHLSDPAHKLSYTTVTQAIPEHWLNVWDQYDWVEDSVAETLRLGVEVIGQEYIVGRMGWARATSVETTGEDVRCSCCG
ncbi:maintenance of telomere capping protein 1 [Russula earlei]|uniref:Maintenance of telomere capping protein 1 n=1 Tax=Russula earlei TaxID=71964 RepID=A0ACC0UKT0_9AGAM|nr:maintenance of telomere capping protein 1 [Russula earlei]